MCAPKYEAAATYYDSSSDEYKKPSYINSSVLTFIPSTNISPTEVVPVLLWDSVQNGPVIRPMVWGLIPPWATENYKSGQYTTHNCRIENVATSPLFRVPITTGKRCVILCEGYYEWKTLLGKHKQPCFIYKAQPQGIKSEEESHWNSGEWSKRTGWVGPSLTCLAGLYSVFDSKKDNELIFSGSIITLKSSEKLSNIHSRMPAILSTQEKIKDWLNSEDIEMQEAINNLEASDLVGWHEVSTDVNSSRNKNSTCNKPVDTRKQGGKQTSLTSFFRKPKIDNDQTNPPKKAKHN